MSARCCTKAAANASEAASMAVCARPLSPPKPDIQSPKRVSRSASVMCQGSALWKYLQRRHFKCGMSCAKSGVPKKGANIPNVSALSAETFGIFAHFFGKCTGRVRGGFGIFFFYYILRKFTKERTCPHTIDWQHGIEHAARRQMHLCCTASNRIFRRYEGLTRFSWAGGTSIYLHIIVDYPIVFLNMTDTSVV